MRHVRMLGLCLVAVFAMSAVTLSFVSPALASGAKPAACNQECKELKEKEKQEAKEKKEQEKAQKKAEKEAAKRQKEHEKQLKKHPNGGEFEIFDDCPLGNAALSACTHGQAGPESFFQAGKVTIKFVKPVFLNIGLVENEETGALTAYAARDGLSISRTPEPAPSLTEEISPEALPESEKTRYEEYLAAGKSVKVTATIELAQPTSDLTVNEANLIGEQGTALGFPVMIHISNAFLGTHCYIGNTAEPIEVPFTTGETSPEPPNTPIHGHLGHIFVFGEGNILGIEGSDLVNNSYAAPGASGCGILGGLDSAMNTALGLPSPAGSNTTELIGELDQAGANAVREHFNY